MDFYRANVLIHVLGAVALVGMGLFWFVMTTAIRQRFDQAETNRLLSIVNQARWPHVVIPYRMRAPLPLVSWAMLAVLLLTGAIAGFVNGIQSNEYWWVKVALLCGLFGIQVQLSRSPAPRLIQFNFATILAIVVFSGLMVR